MSSGCVQCKKNQDIFKIRNNIAHFNLFIATKEDFNTLLENITSNLNFIAEKLYEYTKKLIMEELKTYIKSKTIDDYNYMEAFESLNRQYYLSFNDYYLIASSGNLKNIRPNTPKYYLDKYIKEVIKIDV